MLRFTKEKVRVHHIGASLKRLWRGAGIMEMIYCAQYYTGTN